MLSTKQGDQRARAELLGRLLLAIEEKPSWARVGSGRAEYRMIMIPVADEKDRDMLKNFPEGEAKTIVIDGKAFIPLPLESEVKAGGLPEKVYDNEEGEWKLTPVGLLDFP